MKYVLGMSYKEIGDKLNMTTKHVDADFTSQGKGKKTYRKGGLW